MITGLTNIGLRYIELVCQKDSAQIADLTDTLSKKGQEWVKFAMGVLHLIESDTLMQYGDSEGAINLTPDQIISNIERYLRRYGHGAQSIEAQRWDFKKIAHYTQLLAQKFEEENHE